MAKDIDQTSSTNTGKDKSSDFRGLTVFELAMILAVIGSVVLWAFSARAKIRNETFDEIRKARVVALKENLKSYLTANNTFPSQFQFDDDESRTEILSDYISDEGEDVFFDPKFKDNFIFYYPEPEGCLATSDSPCEKISLSFRLSDGEDFFRFALKPGTEFKYIDDESKGLLNGENPLESSNGKLLEGVESVPEPGD